MISSVNTLSFFSGVLGLRLFPALSFEERARMVQARIWIRQQHHIAHPERWEYAFWFLGLATWFIVLIVPMWVLFTQIDGEFMAFWVVLVMLTQTVWWILQLPMCMHWLYDRSIALRSLS